MNAWWYAWDGELDNTDCDELRLLTTQVDFRSGKVGQTDSSLNSKIRSSDVIGIDYTNPYSGFLNNLVYKYIVMANRECFGFNLNGMYEFQIGKYGKDNFYAEHMDSNLTNNTAQRKLSISIQLSDSDEYEGGDFVFTKDIPSPDAELIRKKGTIIVFPSFLYHQVMPVTKGVRYSLVGWYEGNDWI